MKKKGSALIFSILILTFFLAISLNIYFLSRKKARRAYTKVKGEKVTNNIDIASSIGYEELLLAASFTITGFLYEPSHPVSDDFSNQDGLPSYSSGTNSSPLFVDLSTGLYVDKYAGIHLNDFIHYFSSSWDYSAVSTSNQNLVVGEVVENGVVTSRLWQSTGISNKLSYLWDEPTGTKSLGGYTLKVAPIFPTSNTLGTNLSATYEKVVRLKGNSNINSIAFKIEVTESFLFIKSGSDESVSSRNISSFLVEVIEE